MLLSLLRPPAVRVERVGPHRRRKTPVFLFILLQLVVVECYKHR